MFERIRMLLLWLEEASLVVAIVDGIDSGRGGQWRGCWRRRWRGDLRMMTLGGWDEGHFHGNGRYGRRYNPRVGDGDCGLKNGLDSSWYRMDCGFRVDVGGMTMTTYNTNGRWAMAMVGWPFMDRTTWTCSLVILLLKRSECKDKERRRRRSWFTSLVCRSESCRTWWWWRWVDSKGFLCFLFLWSCAWTVLLKK